LSIAFHGWDLQAEVKELASMSVNEYIKPIELHGSSAVEHNLLRACYHMSNFVKTKSNECVHHWACLKHKKAKWQNRTMSKSQCGVCNGYQELTQLFSLSDI